MTARQALVRIVSSNDYLRLRFIVAKAGVGEGDAPEKCREAVGALARRIKKAIRKLWRELPKGERQRFKNLLQGELRGLRNLLKPL